MRNCETPRDRQCFNSPILFHSLGIWSCTGRSVSLPLLTRLQPVIQWSPFSTHMRDRVYEIQEPSSAVYSKDTHSSLLNRLDTLQGKATSVLKEQGFEEDKIQAERFLNMRFDGTDTSIMVLDPADGSHDFEAAFKKQYKEEFGFVLEDKNIIVDDIKVRGLGKTFDTLGETVYEELNTLKRNEVNPSSSKKSATYSVYFDEIGRVDDTPVFELPSLEVGDVIKGPAMIIDDTQTIVVVPKSEVTVASRHLVIRLC